MSLRRRSVARLALAGAVILAWAIIGSPIAGAIGPVGPDARWPACPSASGASDDPLPVARPALDPVLYPPPPASFRPEAVRFVGTRTGVMAYGDPVWVGAIDGSGMRCASPAHGRVSIVPGDRVVYADTIGPGMIFDLATRDPSGVVRRIADRVEWYSVGPRFAWVGRRSGTERHPGEDLGVWRARLDGSGMRRVLPPADRPRASWMVGSADGRSVAIARYYAPGTGNGEPVPPIRVRFDGGPIRRIPYLVPVGFDADGRLVGRRGNGVVAYDPARGRRIPLRLGRQGAIVTPRGHWIIAWPAEIPGGAGRSRIRAIHVDDGSRHTWALAPGDWNLSPELSTDDYVVLQDALDGTKIGVIGLADGWVGYLRFIAAPAARVSRAPDLQDACRATTSGIVRC